MVRHPFRFPAAGPLPFPFRRPGPPRPDRRLLAGLLFGLLPGAIAAGSLPPVWGFGVQSCAAFVTAADGHGQDLDLARWEYRRYEDWLTGLVTGLNLATGRDVLAGADIATALRRMQAHCRGHPEQDFFTAAMDLVRLLSQLR